MSGASDVVAKPLVSFGEVIVMDAAVIIFGREMRLRAADAAG